ncbi:hypothetical protein N2152v2_010908 [Parachlorella kessleri]
MDPHPAGFETEGNRVLPQQHGLEGSLGAATAGALAGDKGGVSKEEDFFTSTSGDVRAAAADMSGSAGSERPKEDSRKAAESMLGTAAGRYTLDTDAKRA